MNNTDLSATALRVFRAEEDLHLANSRKLSVRIVKRRERAVEEAKAKLTPEQLQAQRDHRAKMNGF
jgi:hypothetical protein